MACQVGSAVVLPKTCTTPHITLKPILQTLTTRVWVVSWYHWMGLMVPIFFTKSNQIGTIKSEQGDFSVYLKPLFFCSTSGRGFWQAHPSCSWDEQYLEPWCTPRSFLVCLFWGYIMSFNAQIPVLQKRKDLMLIF
jgi:hypothetical protein